MFDYLIVGAGFAGSVLAERLASQSSKKILIDTRSHIGGNAYDHYDAAGILVHKYGPHIFTPTPARSSSTLALHRVAVLSTVLQVWTVSSYPSHLTSTPSTGSTAESHLIPGWGVLRVSCWAKEYIRTSEDVVVQRLELYEKFFRGYTRKQWGIDPSELDKSVTARVPTRTVMGDISQTRIRQCRCTDIPDVREDVVAPEHQNHAQHWLSGDWKVIPYQRWFTGPWMNFSITVTESYLTAPDFQHETINTPVHQTVAVVNYPNEHLYTRVTEFKYLTGQSMQN